MFKAAKRFILTQRIEELEKSMQRHPDSPKFVDRQIEHKHKQKIKELEELEGTQ